MRYMSLEARMKASVCGVGCMGSNLDLKSIYNGKLCKIYRQWQNMIVRCYNERYHIRFPTYTGCYVSDEFKDYSKWREWYDNYPYKQDGWHLDKDLLVKGNRVYSEDSCVFLPHIINSTLTKSNKNRGNYLIGTYFDTHNNKFKACMTKYGKNTTLGYFENEIEAHLAYKEAKESYIKELADKYKDLLDPRAYEALYNYTVDIDD